MKLLERASQLQTLDSALTQTKSGRGCVALVYGEAGIGKTSLVEHFIDSYKTSWRVLHGACDSLFTPRPLGPLHDIAAQISSPKGVAGSLFTLLRSETSREELFSTCLGELKEQRTILVIEDIHWADEATLDLLKYLGRRIRQTVSLIILTYRDDEIGNDHPLRFLLGDLATSHSLYHIAVSPLSKNAVYDLSEGKNVDTSKLHRLTNGNPFFVTEILAVEGGIPETVRDAVLARAARLSVSARAVLEAAAVIGSRAEAWLLSNIVGVESAYVEECIATGMLQGQGSYYAFRHELARQTILESISPQRKIELHHLALNVLKGSPETRNDLARLANHAEEIRDAAAVLEYTPAAARQASLLGAHREAAAHYRTALRYAELLHTNERAELLDAYAFECDLTDHMVEARQAQFDALRFWRELGQREKEGRALRRLSEIAYKQYQNPEMERYASDAIRVLETLPPSKELAMAYSHKSRLHLVAEQYDETIHWGARAVELAEKLDDIETLVHAVNNIGLQELRFGHRADGRAKLERSLQMSLEHDLHDHAARAFDNLSDALMTARDYTASLQCSNEGIAYCIKHDLDFWRVILMGHRAEVKFRQGQWSKAEQDLSAAESAWSEPIEELMLPRLWLKVRRGDPLLREELDIATGIAHTSPLFEFTCSIAAILAEAAWLQGDLAQCRAQASQLFEIARERNVRDVLGNMAYWIWRSGTIMEMPVTVIEPYATQIAGNWQEAAVLWEKYGCPYEQGMALMDGDETAQRLALEIFERLGALPIMEKLKRQMHRQGIRILRSAQPTRRANLFDLTVREQDVMRLMADGHTNLEISQKLFLSEKTVRNHISNIYQKLQITSRGKAIVLARKLISEMDK